MAQSVPSSRSLIPLDRLADREVIASLELFAEASSEELDRLYQGVTRLRRSAGTELLSQGAVPDGLYVLLRGRVNLVRVAPGGRDLIVVSYGAGGVLGESCAFERAGGTTAAVAATPVELLRLPAEAVAAHVRRCPETLLRLTQLMADKLRELEDVASSLALDGVEERLRQTLVRLAQSQGRQASRREWILTPVPTQSELARMVGSRRETVSRTLAAMAREGLIHASGRRMVLDARLWAA